MSNLDENVPSRAPDGPGDTAFTSTFLMYFVLTTQLVDPPIDFNNIPAAPKQRRHEQTRFPLDGVDIASVSNEELALNRLEQSPANLPGSDVKMRAVGSSQ